jgi:hypothetical protein
VTAKCEIVPVFALALSSLAELSGTAYETGSISTASVFAVSPRMQASGARPPYPYMAQQGMPAAGPTGSGPPSGSMAPPSVGGPGHALTGGPISGGYTGALSVAAAGPTGGLAYPPGFTPPSSADMQRYVTVFASTDADRDGMVKGSECFPVFIQSGLDKGVLKRMWDLVAGTAGGHLAVVVTGGGKPLARNAHPHEPGQKSILFSTPYRVGRGGGCSWLRGYCQCKQVWDALGAEPT